MVGVTTDGANGTTWTSTYPVDLSGLKWLLVSITHLRDNYTWTNSRRYSYRLPVRGAKGDIMEYGNDDFVQADRLFSTPQELDEISIRITDIDGNTINFNGADHSIEFLVE